MTTEKPIVIKLVFTCPNCGCMTPGIFILPQTDRPIEVECQCHHCDQDILRLFDDRSAILLEGKQL